MTPARLPSTLLRPTPLGLTSRRHGWINPVAAIFAFLERAEKNPVVVDFYVAIEVLYLGRCGDSFPEPSARVTKQFTTSGFIFPLSRFSILPLYRARQSQVLRR